MASRSIVALLVALSLLTAPRIALADDDGPPTAEMYAGALLGPSVPIDPSGSVLFWFGGEFAHKRVNTALMFNPQSGLFKVRLTSVFMYDHWFSSRFALSPFGGIDFTMGFGDLTLIQLGLTIGGRVTFMLTRTLGIFVEPLTFDFPFFQYVKIGGASGSDFDFRIAYRANVGVNFRF